MKDGLDKTTLEDETLADWFKGLSEPNRMAIVRHLLTGEHRVTDLVEHLGLAQSTVSAYVAVLRNAGMLSSHAHGRATYYELAHIETVRKILHLASSCVSEPEATNCAERKADQ